MADLGWFPCRFRKIGKNNIFWFIIFNFILQPFSVLLFLEYFEYFYLLLTSINKFFS